VPDNTDLTTLYWLPAPERNCTSSLSVIQPGLPAPASRHGKSGEGVWLSRAPGGDRQTAAVAGAAVAGLGAL